MGQARVKLAKCICGPPGQPPIEHKEECPASPGPAMVYRNPGVQIPVPMAADIEKLHEELLKHAPDQTPDSAREFIVNAVIFNGILRLAAVVKKMEEAERGSMLVQPAGRVTKEQMDGWSAKMRAIKEGRA